MTRLSTGDFDYDAHSAGYADQRRPDPRIAALVHAALGPARTVLNVGAGAGSYEPEDRYVIAIEPAAAMRARGPAPLPICRRRSTASPKNSRWTTGPSMPPWPW